MQTNAEITLLNDGEYFDLIIHIPKQPNIQEVYDHICFSFVSPFTDDQLNGGTLVERQGDWHRILLDEPLRPEHDIRLTVRSKGSLTKASDYPEGVYLENNVSRLKVSTNAKITRNTESNYWLKSKTAAFIPQCDVVEHESTVTKPKAIHFQGEIWSIDWFERMTGKLGFRFESKTDQAWLLSAQCDGSLDVLFKLEISQDGGRLIYRDKAGFYQGQAFILQYLLQLIKNEEMFALTLQGGAYFSYRGIHIDVVRHFFSAATLQEWLDVFALFHYNQFHWHLTDDDGWRVPSDAFPELEQKGSVRGPGLTLPPQMGTGCELYQGIYSKDQIKHVVRHASELGINVVPEMDLPGHARALLKALPELQEKEDQSLYQSVQFFDDNVINPAYGDTINIVKTLLSEWCELFPGRLFHIGSDEIPAGVWQRSPSALQWAAETNQPIENLQGVLLNAVEQHLSTFGKTMAGWEEVVEGEGTSSNTWVYSWQGVDAGIKAAKLGHSIVMTPAQHCYLDLAVTTKHDDPGYYWAGTVDLAATYNYDPYKGVPIEYQGNIKGVQMCLWSELIHNKTDAEYMMFPRLLAGSELGFNNNTKGDFSAFYGRVQRWMPLLSALGFSVRAEKDSW
ncbi:family 20 glycosylhydrolase [Reinekea forsetii]|nr:family 20 glycosylhydrolase [Reinekea forsetii]